MSMKTATRRELIELINDEYNEGRKKSYATDYTKSIRLLPTETLRSIMRSIKRGSEDPTVKSVVHSFRHRAKYTPAEITRFTELFESEFFHVHKALTDTYSLHPDVIAKADAIAGVLVLEDKHGPLTSIQKHQIAMILATVGWTGTMETWGLNHGAYGNYSLIYEDALINYIYVEHSDAEFHELMNVLCSGQKYARFLEVVEIVTEGGTKKALLSGIL